MNKNIKIIEIIEDKNQEIISGTISFTYRWVLNFLYAENIGIFDKLEGIKWPEGERILISTNKNKLYNEIVDYHKPVIISKSSYYADIHNLSRRPEKSISMILDKLGYSADAIETVVKLFDRVERQKAISKWVDTLGL